MDEENIKQKIDYRPQIHYEQNYYTDNSIDTSDITPQRIIKSFDNETIPSIKDDIQYLDGALKAIPTRLSNAIREVYDPIKELYEEVLWGKIVDPNPQNPGVIMTPIPIGDDDDGNPPIPPTVPPPDFTVYPIVLLPVTKDDDKDDGDDDDGGDNEETFPIVLLPIDNDNDDDGGDDDPSSDSVPPIVLLPIPSDEEDDDEEEPIDDDDDDEGMWEPPNIEIIDEDPVISDLIERDYVFIISKLIKNYTSMLKDIINNYYFNVIRLSVGHSKEEKDFILNSLKINNDDIYNKCKHLLDISVKNENTANLKTSFLENSFNIVNTLRHTKSFTVSYELRKRYTNIQYSNGKSMANSSSDALLKNAHINYEIQFATSFENLFRYLNSSLVVTNDIFKIMIQDILSKETIIKKGGKK